MRGAFSALHRVPVAARWCALAAFANALVWSIVTPPFHVPDETGHLVYVQHLAETGDVPDDQGEPPFSPELGALLVAVRFNEVAGRTRERVTPSEYSASALVPVVENPPDPVGAGGAIETSSQPPLFYALAAGVYHASPWQDLLHRLWLMRLLSAAFAALTTLFTFLFLRELLSEPWTWTIGALAVAFQPLFGFISGGVHPDSLTFAASAALLFALARSFRRGLTPGLGVAVGLALAVGVFTKLNFFALVPGALLGVALLVWRSAAGRPAALRGAGACLGVLAVAALVFVSLNTLVWDRPASGRVPSAAAAQVTPPATVHVITRAEQLSYSWQLYLPRMPFMEDQFTSYPLYQTFFKGTIGLFGWLDTPFPEWVYTLALVLTFPLLALLIVALWRRRGAVRRRWAELAAYAAISAGLLLSVGFFGISYRQTTGFAFEQARYLLPLLPFYAAGLVLAVRGVGARFERPLAAAVLVLAMGHGLFAQLLVISRFYG